MYALCTTDCEYFHKCLGLERCVLAINRQASGFSGGKEEGARREFQRIRSNEPKPRPPDVQVFRKNIRRLPRCIPRQEPRRYRYSSADTAYIFSFKCSRNFPIFPQHHPQDDCGTFTDSLLISHNRSISVITCTEKRKYLQL